jgi:signal transduction histidine kinase
MFVVVAAAYRWGFRATAGTAAVTVAVFLIETAVAVAGPWNTTSFAPDDIELNRTIMRTAYLLLTGVLLAYFAEQEKQSRSELAAMADLARQPQVHLGLGGSITAFARGLSVTFRAAAVTVVVRDHETHRTFLWQLDRSTDAAGGAAARRIDLDPGQQAIWFFPDPGRTWHASVHATVDGSVSVRVTEPDAWHLKRQSMALPDAFAGARSCRTVTAVNLGLANEWHARVYLFDIAEKGSLERRLHFLEALAEHVTPALTNVFLLRRLRARAGAAERARVARELHDGAIQSLFGIEMKMEAIRRQPPSDPAAVERALAELQGMLRREILSLRELMQALRPIELDSGDQLPDVLAGLVERFRRDSGISARFVSTGASVALPPAKAIEIVRIVQEALVNVRKHSQARNVLVRVGNGDGAWRLVVEDDGRGFDFEGRLSARELDERRVGPAIIKERARIVGAELAIDSSPGVGARVELVLTGGVRG